MFAATPASDFICGTLQTAAGMNMHVFTTGEGTPYGLAMVPVIKVSTRTALAERWHDLIDIDAGRIVTGSATIEDVGQEIFRLILEVASGRKLTWTDHWGLHNARRCSIPLRSHNSGSTTDYAAKDLFSELECAMNKALALSTTISGWGDTRNWRGGSWRSAAAIKSKG